MAKNLDGIKKLNLEEKKKNRKIVLSYIGEKDKEPELIKGTKTTSRLASVFNKVDGIKLNRISDFKLKTKNILTGPAPVRDDRASQREKINLEKERARRGKIEREELARKQIADRVKREAEEKAKAEEAGKKLKEELAKKEIAEKAKLLALEKAKAEEARKWREKLALEEKDKEEKRIMKENKRLEKIKRKEEIKRIKQEIKLAKAKAAAERKIKKQKAIKLFKKNLNNKLVEIFSVIKQNFVYGILYLVVFLIIIYVVFCLLVLRFKIDNNIIGELARTLPVPAVITSQGIINYNDFRNIKNNYANLNSAEKKNNLLEWIILKNLTKKYGLPVNSSSQTLALAFSADEDYNQIGLSRIKKISQLLKNVDDIEQLGRYADEYSEVIYYDNESAADKFGQAVLNLNVNQASDIIIGDNGYYIVQAVENKNGQLGIKYLFVAAKTLDQYVGERLSKIKIFILAN